jgi:hypothetical protein
VSGWSGRWECVDCGERLAVRTDPYSGLLLTGVRCGLCVEEQWLWERSVICD